MDAEKLAAVITGLIERLGFAAMVSAYFMFRDYKHSERQTKASEDLAANLAVLIEKLDAKGD